MKKWNSRERWKHYAFLGSMRIAELSCHKILDAQTTTKEAKNLANKILKNVNQMQQELETLEPPKQ